MSNKVLVQQIQPVAGGPLYGQVSDPNDFENAQIFSHEHIEEITKDFLMSGAISALVAGFALTLTGDLQFTVNPGRVVDVNGIHYESDSVNPTALQVAAPDANLPRIDLVYATLAADVQSNSEFRPFARLRTQAELNAGVAPYPPTQFNQPTELHNTATVQVRSGTPANAPVAPATNPNEVPLYLVRVAANAQALRPTDVIDVRALIVSLQAALSKITNLSQNLNQILSAANIVDARDVEIGSGAGDYVGSSLQQFINDYTSRHSSYPSDPLTRPEIIELLNDPAPGSIGAVGNIDNGNAAVDIYAGRQVAFADSVVTIEPNMFDPSLNARFALNVAPNSTQENIQPLSLAVLSQIESDSDGDFAQKLTNLPTARSYAAAAARDSRYIEIFGGSGAGGGGSASLGDWMTYDTVADALTVRQFTGDVPPTASRPFMASCGDGTRVLIGTSSFNQNQVAQWFLLDTTSGESTNIPSAMVGSRFYGALIQQGIIFICAIAQDGTVTYWTFDTNARAFSQIFPSGVQPTFPDEYCDGCIYQAGQFVVFENQPGVPASGATYIFDYASLTWTKLAIASPYGGNSAEQIPLAQFCLRNANGRPMLVGGAQDQVGGSTVWELTPGAGSANPVWRSVSTHLPRRDAPAFASTLNGNLPTGDAFVISGIDANMNLASGIYAYERGGVVETNYNGVLGITLGPGATYARFLVPNVDLTWLCAYYYANLSGYLPSGSVLLECSMDGGLTFQQVTRDSLISITNASTPSERVLRITLYSLGQVRPILTKLHEFCANGLSGINAGGLLVRFTPEAVRSWVSLSRTGQITSTHGLSNPSDANNCVLCQITPQGAGQAPSVLSYFNKRRIFRKYTGTQNGSNAPSFQLDIGAKPSFIQLIRVTPDGVMHLLADPPSYFNTTITVNGLSSGDSYLLIVAA